MNACWQTRPGSLVILVLFVAIGQSQTFQDYPGNPWTKLTVRVPADARVFLGGVETGLTGELRLFESRPLAFGRQWDSYSVRAEINRDGRLLRQEQRFALVGGRRYELQFDFSSNASTTTTLIVHVPADALVYMSGRRMNKTGAAREFNSTALSPGETWESYPVRAEVTRGGQLLQQEQRIALVGGLRQELRFDFGGMPPGEDRLSTQQLEEYIWERAYGDEKFDWEIDNFMANQKWLQGDTGGGVFGLAADTEFGRVTVYDNKATYLWSHTATPPGGASSIPSTTNRVGHRLPPERYFNHIIPMRMGLDQPEMLKFIKEGDICVYWHPEEGRNDDAITKFAKMNGWRCTHAAMVIERQMQVPDTTGRLVPKTVLSTVDTPDEWAKPFSGGATIPFHVFRFMPRDEDGNALPDELARAYRSQAARWGTLMFKKTPFSSNYDEMRLRFPQQIIVDAMAFLDPANGPESAPAKYCALYAFTALSLGYMTPINRQGLPDDLFGPFAYDSLATDQSSPLRFLSDQHKYGDGTLADYSALPDLPARRDEFPFPPTTAPELIMNMFDRIIGPDVDFTDSVQSWQQHAVIKAGLLIQLKDHDVEGTSVMDRFRLNPDPQVATQQGDLDSRTPAEIAEYNEKVRKAFDDAITLYSELATADYSQGITAVQQAYEKVRAFSAQLVATARSGNSRGKKWIPPSGFFREADAYHQFYQDPSQPLYNPRMVYVGTVVHIDFLKKAGDSDRPYLEPRKPTEKSPYDDQFYSDNTINQVLGLPTDSNAVEGLWNKLTTEDARTGLNSAERDALELMRQFWIEAADLPADPTQLALQFEDIASHNRFGLDPVLFRRLLVAYWNDPASLRKCIHADPTVTIASAVNNARQLFAYTEQADFQPMISVMEHERNDAARPVPFPRRTSDVPTGAQAD